MLPEAKVRRILREELAMRPISHMMGFEQLSSMHDVLDNQLVNDEISLSEYEKEWNDLLRSVGWTPERYERELDRRWDYVDKTRDIPVRGFSARAN